MNRTDRDILQSTMEGLETGLKVLHIASFDLTVCDVEDDVADTLNDAALGDLDQFPVKDGDRVVGVLERPNNNSAASGPAKEHMRRLDDSMLLSAEEPITRFIPLAANSAYRLVVKGPEIKGIVTRSDLLKLPVRLLVFTLVTHLEMVMSGVISTKCIDNSKWLSLMSGGRRAKLEEKLETLRAKKLDPPLLELIEFCDKRDIVAKLCGYGAIFQKELKEIEELRNAVAHAASYAQNDDEVKEFVTQLHAAEHWIGELNSQLAFTVGL